MSERPVVKFQQGVLEDARKPLYPGVHLIHLRTGFGYVVDSIAADFDNHDVEVVVLRRHRMLSDALFVIPIEELRGSEDWQYVGL